MGIYKPVAVGDFVWLDSNRNGLQEPNESGVMGVRVTLYNAANNQPVTQDAYGNQITPQVTNDSGYYSFDGLPPGNYYAIFDLTTLPAGYRVTLPNVGGNNGIDSDANPDTGKTAATGALESGQVNLSLDMGIRTPVSVGDRIWYDDNANGVQDGVETGVKNVRVTLYNAVTNQPVQIDANNNPVQAQVTNDSGNYLFTNLLPGNYYVKFDLSTLPAGTRPTVANTVSNDTIDSDADRTTGQTAATGYIPSASNNSTLDMGVVRPVSVGDVVWYDNNKNGVQDQGEPGVADVIVRLFTSAGQPATDMNGNVVAPQQTNGSGNYLFTNVPPGSYYVQFDLNTLPLLYVATSPNAGNNDALDSDANPGNGTTATTPFLPATSRDSTLDMGIIKLSGVRVGDYVWIDANANGQQDAGEQGVAGIKVTLYNATTGQPMLDDNGQPRVDMTDSSGYYLFEQLLPGNYFIKFDLTALPAGHVVTIANQGNDGSDSDADRNSGQTSPTGALADGQQNLTLDMGIVLPASLGNYVWVDHDVNGLQDAGEAPLVGVVVKLFRTDGSPALDINGLAVPAQGTDSNGHYQFANLWPGSYYVVFTPPASYSITLSEQGSNDTNDSDADRNSGKTVVTTLSSGENDPTWDTGFFQPVALGNYVWYDKNGNGVQESDEAPIAGVIVTLYDKNGNKVATTQTDSNGHYGFSGLTPGDYYLTFETPNGLIATRPNQGGNDQADSDIVNGRTEITTLSSGEFDPNWDAGFILPAGIGGVVWFDGTQQSSDGIKEPTESVVPDVTVLLLDENGNQVASTTTNETGSFAFTGLPLGNYSLVFITLEGTIFTQNIQTVSETNSDPNQETGKTPTTELSPGEFDPSWGAGFIQIPTSLAEGEEVQLTQKVFLPAISR